MAYSTTIRTALRWSLVVLVAAVAGLPLVAAQAAPADVPYVKYYQVASSYQGKPENLSEIAGRFLGTTNRSAEVFELNVGHKQPDGAALTDPSILHAGWYLTLPWDAVGTGVHYGTLPTGTSGGSGGSPSTKKPAPRRTPPPSPTPPVQHCTTASASSSQSDWASLRLSPDQAWAHTRGKGEVVAIVDSGVDGSLSQLAGHVNAGADVVAGSDRGDVDCLGTGTRMASIVAAQPAQHGAPTGIAPDATVMPVRVVTTAPTAQAADVATAINVAVSAGATVIALGGYASPQNPAVASAIASAANHDVVVVAPARTQDRAAGLGGPVAALLRVGGVSVDGRPVAPYVAGGVDVVAPGLNIATLGLNGAGVQSASGTQYAAAYVAGEAALVRAAYPQLTAAAVAQRVKLTADKLGNSVPDGQYGYGMINPGTAVSEALPNETQYGQHSPAPAAGGQGGRTAVTLVAGLVGLVALLLLILRVRNTLRHDRDAEPAEENESEEEADGTRPTVALMTRPPR